MDNRAQVYQLIKSDIKTKLNDMNKIVLTTEIDEESMTDRAMNDKMLKIREKLNRRRATLQESSEKTPYLSKSNIQKANKFIDIDNDEEFRSFNIYIPKISLCQSTAPRTTFSQLNPMFNEKIKESSGVLNSINNEFIFSVIHFKKREKLNQFRPNYSFFERKYVEYQYQEIADKSKGLNRKNTKLYQAFRKLMDDNSNQLYHVSPNSLILKHYNMLLKLEESNKYTELDEMRVREDELVYDPKEEEEKQKKFSDSKRNKGETIYSQVNNLDNKLNENISINFKRWFFEEVETLQNEKVNNKQITLQKRKSLAFTDKPQEEGNNTGQGDTSQITFGIHFQFYIDKAIRMTNNYHQRIMQIDGPMANWYRFKEKQTSNLKKGSFDLRKIQINRPPDQVDEKREEFIVKYKHKNKLNVEEDKEVKFKSEFFKTLTDKTIRDIFEQIKRYYLLINNMLKLHRVDYQKLRFISDPKVTQLNIFREDTNPDTIKSLIDNIDWHLKLKKVHLRGVDKTSIQKFFLVLNSSNEILLESITIESTKNSHVIEFDSQSNNQLLSLMKTFFTKKCCVRLTEFNLVDVKIPEIKPILDILRCKFAFLKKYGKIVQMNEDDLKNNIPLNQDMKMPFTKLSFKKSFDNTNSQINICLNELYSFFRDMLNEFEGKFENIFENLDISGADCFNIEGLKNIINTFKIIRDLNLSATKISSSIKGCNTTKEKYVVSNNQHGKQINTISPNSFLINNIDFLRSLNMRENNENDLFSFKKEYNMLTTTQQSINYPLYYNNVEPILSNLYILDTPVTPETFFELMELIKRMKFMRTIHLSEHLQIVPNGDCIKFANVLSDVKKEDDFFCENFYDIDYVYTENK